MRREPGSPVIAAQRQYIEIYASFVTFIADGREDRERDGTTWSPTRDPDEHDPHPTTAKVMHGWRRTGAAARRS